MSRVIHSVEFNLKTQVAEMHNSCCSIVRSSPKNPKLYAVALCFRKAVIIYFSDASQIVTIPYTVSSTTTIPLSMVSSFEWGIP